MISRIVVLGFLMIVSATAGAYPDLGTQFSIGELTVIRDKESPNTFYYLPDDLVIPEREDGGPHLAFTVAVYTGRSVHGDQGERYVRSTFFSRLRRTQREPTAYDDALSSLQQQFGSRVILREIPLANVEARILYSDVDGEQHHAGDGFLEPAAGGQGRTLWHERDVFLSFDNATAQILKRQLEEGSLGISLSYSFYAYAWLASDGDGELTGSADIVDELTDTTSTEDAERPELIAIKSDAFPIRIGEAFRDSRIRLYHIDETMPPDYASLVVYCFDFRNEEREGLFEKVVLVEASGVAGGTTRHSAVFSSDSPDVYARTVRFPFAVDLRKPYRWRVEEILETGEFQSSRWRESETWADIIDASGDVTTWDDDLAGDDS